MKHTRVLLYTACIALAACGTKPIAPSDKHIQQSNTAPASTGSIPEPSKRAVVLPPPKPAAKVETFSVVVTSLSARDILFALARDAKVNIDIHPGIQGVVTINAINQTLPQILDRISKQVDMRYELENGNLIVMPDTPFLRSYKIDYVNMSRDSEGGITNTNQVGGTGTSGNNSQLAIKNTSKNHFWDTLIKNIEDILRETDKEIVAGRRSSTAEEEAAKSEEVKGEAASETSAKKTESKGKAGDQDYKDYKTLLAASVIASPEAGIITVRATGKQHDKIQEFVTRVMRSARRQVLIEATIAEVSLNSNFQQGINWSAIAAGAKGFTLTQLATGGLPATNTGNMFKLQYTNATSKFGNLSGAVTLLDSFGDVKVLSSPKISVMNNQTAVLRVVDNLVYFTIKADTTSNQTTTTTTYTTTAVTVPTGFTMSVTPQINDSDSVLLNLRPSITRLLGYVNDPNPSLANPCGVGVSNCATPAIVSKIPQLRTREMESVLKIENNQIAVLGGLMQDEINNLTDGIPVLGDVPVAGNLFKNRNDTKSKTELVIFLRPVVIKDSSLDGDYSAYRDELPGADYLKAENEKSKP
ncbi:MAG: pilus (MSHA type) biogenesis protein MshL [Gammaproteobacteria bacterium]|nr:pilus (MSHA type) biogenesis protein MshL [Gammaproteobacteria bacterium]MBU1777186.1 pilus (MSHA type) biogenesis protein MshL [Gammaproteobacteria bacterium]MBU1968490.1 pilus (MSHA type) biogenesis protein MshL [Gammaproteobacteria bacterium]